VGIFFSFFFLKNGLKKSRNSGVREKNGKNINS
jgi:hypothetical protein